MKVLTGLVLVLYLTSYAVGQDTTCLSDPVRYAEILSQVSTECELVFINDLAPLLSPVRETNATNDAIATLCMSRCVQQIDDIFEQECNLPILSTVCARDEVGSYCFSTSSKQRQLAQMQATGFACAGIDCTDRFCNAAFESLSCCVTTSLESAELFYNATTITFPKGCMLPAACAGGMTLFAMPAVIIMALIAALHVGSVLAQY